jgi:hypothetical protein
MIGRQSLATYLTGVFRSAVDVRAIRRLGGEGEAEDPKGFRHGVPSRGERGEPADDTTRAALLRFARAMAAPTPFDPARAASLLEKPS